MDWLPILSQAKSLVQVVCGDVEGAKQTHENFLKTCPIVSQTTSLVQAIKGDNEGALETQKAFGRTMSGVANGIPLVGHVKGVIHYACGDDEGGEQAMKSSTRTLGVMGGGVGGFFVAGPAGAVAGGIAGGAAMDGITTGIDSARHGEYRPAGHIATVTEIFNSNKNPSGKIFDLTAGVVFDGLTGQAAGQTVGQIAKNIKANNVRANARAAFEQVENNPAATSGEISSAGKAAMAEMTRADAIQGIKTDFTKFGETVQTEPPVFHEPVILSDNKTIAAEAQASLEKVVQKKRYKKNKEGEDDDDDEDEHEKVNRRLKVFYVNAHSINPNPRSSLSEKNKCLKKKIKFYDIVAISETWLNKTQSTNDVQSALGLEDYYIYRCDRVDLNEKGDIRPGGGLIIAVKSQENLTSECLYRYRDNFLLIKLSYKFNCRKCSDGIKNQDYIFGLIYRRGVPYKRQTIEDFNRSDQEFVEIVRTQLRNSPWRNQPSVIVGDFNFNIKFETPSTSNLWDFNLKKAKNFLNFFSYDMYEDWNIVIPKTRDREMYEMFEEYDHIQNVFQPTHEDGNILDLIFSKPKDFVYEINSLGQIQVHTRKQDHLSLIFKLKLGYDCDK